MAEGGRGRWVPLPPVTAVIVTYGRRWKYLSQVLDELVAGHPAVGDIVIVDNGSEDDIESGVNLLSKTCGARIHLSRLETNTGSANGYKTGIETALRETKAELLWLLDDDNKPREQSLERLLSAYHALGDDPNNALASLRRDRPQYLRAAKDGTTVGLKRNSFFGFHIGDIGRRLGRKLMSRSPQHQVSRLRFPLVSIGCAPYGGLLFHRDRIGKIGLPDERFYLYGDDIEFSSRMVGDGGCIYLCATSEIEDLEVSWHLWTTMLHPMMSLESDRLKLYYQVRNQVYLETRRSVSCLPMYALNITAFLGFLAVSSVWFDRKPLLTAKRIRFLVKAMQDGWSGRLGQLETS
jgi:GT2 family glycosyltransferase